MRQDPATHIIDTNAKSYEWVNSKIITIVAIGAPITEAERAAIPASINEDPNIPTPIVFPMYVKIPPIDAPRTKAGENTPPKKPILRQTTVTNNLSNKTNIKKYNEY